MERAARIRILGFVVLAVALVVIEFASPARRFLAPAVSAEAGLEGVVYRATASLRGLFQKFVLGEDAANRLTEMAMRLERFSVDRSRLAALAAENAELRALLRFQDNRLGTALTTRVIGQDQTDPESALRVGLGSDGGIRPGAAVVSPSGALVGVVDRVGPSVSTVTMLLNRRTQVPVRILGKDKTYGLLESPDGLIMRIDQLPTSVAVAPGDVVVTGLGREGLPPGIPVGTVLVVSSPPEGLWQQATVTPLVSPATLDIVSVIVPSTDEGGASRTP